MTDTILAELNTRLYAEQRTDFDQAWLQKYLGTPQLILGWKNETLRALARETVKAHKTVTPEAWLEIIGALNAGPTYEHRVFGSFLLRAQKTLLQTLPLEMLRGWIGRLEGWAEIDNTCQSTWTGAQVLARWDEWQPFLADAARDGNISLRRASLVLLNKPLRTSDDLRLSAQAFANLDILQHERATLITKAVSWLLRDLIHNHRDDVVKYLDANSASLPKIALRETRKKLETGVKTPRRITS